MHVIRTYAILCATLAGWSAATAAFSAPLDQELAEAVRWGDAVRVEALLQAGANSNTIDPEGFTPLFWASAAGSKQIVAALINASADVNGRALFGDTPLMAAAAWGHEEVVRLLLDHGANVNAKTDQSSGPLFAAAARGHLGVVKLLLARGADAAVADQRKATPLMAAGVYAGPEVVRILVQHGAYVNARDDDGRTALMCAAYRGRPANCNALVEVGADVSARDAQGETALTLAARTGQVAVVRLLLDAGADPDAKNHAGMTPRDIAKQAGFADVVQVLHERVTGTSADASSARPEPSAHGRSESGPQLREVPPDVLVVERPRKIAQIIGEYDRELKQLTANRTTSRFKVAGTDLGVPFAHNGRTYLLFGDTYGLVGGDCIAVTSDINLEDGLDLEFIHDGSGVYRAVQVPGVSQGNMEVPVEGVSVGGIMYTYHATDFSSRAVIGRTVLAASRDDGRTFRYIYDLSRRYFLNVSVVKADASRWKGLPQIDGEALLIFGTGLWRKSDVRLAVQPAAQIESRDAVRYFAGTDQEGGPIWSPNESDALPLFNQPCAGELSVAFNSLLNKWIMLYNCGWDRLDVRMRTADTPWGPWSSPQILFDPDKDAALCRFMHSDWRGKQCDILHEPGRERMGGIVYGPYLFEDVTIGSADAATIYFTLSTWNPYTVLLMKATLGKAP